MKLLERQLGPVNHRFAVQLEDAAVVEAVVYRGHTLCVSSQVGCAVRCPFCASGRRGLLRNLSLEELIFQVESTLARGYPLRQVTVSGVGEPLHNQQAASEFALWCHRRVIRMSLTTSGGPLGHLRQWFELPHNGLTISVHAGTEQLRAQLMPSAPALGPLFSVLEQQFRASSRSRRRKIAIAYLLLAGKNDCDSEVDAFVERALPSGAAVHLYAYNQIDQDGFGPASRASYERVYGVMKRAGLVVRMSSQARLEDNGGCGTLVAGVGWRQSR